MSDQQHNPDDERPWSEAQWEAFMRKADARSAMYQERLETEFERRESGETDAIDHAAIRQDMGWSRQDDEGGDEADDGVDRPWLDDLNNLTDEDLAEADAEMKESDEALEKIIPYQRSLTLTDEISEWLKPLMNTGGDPESDRSRLLGALYIGPAICGAKIAGGHGMGYHEDVLCGNIVNNRRGLEALHESKAALEELRTMNVIAPDVAAKIERGLDEMIGQMNERIAELRSKVWW